MMTKEDRLLKDIEFASWFALTIALGGTIVIVCLVAIAWVLL